MNKIFMILRAPVLKAVHSMGYELNQGGGQLPLELPEFDKDAIRFIKEKKFSMVSTARLVQTAKSVRYAVENNVSGDFVECGVWRGGNAILAKLIFSELGSDKKVYLYDTFAGMTEPQENDAVQSTQIGARKTHPWCQFGTILRRQAQILRG
jgi:hypothetical protein